MFFFFFMDGSSVRPSVHVPQMCVCIQIYIYARAPICVYASVHVYAHVCMCACVYLSVCVYVYCIRICIRHRASWHEGNDIMLLWCLAFCLCISVDPPIVENTFWHRYPSRAPKCFSGRPSASQTVPKASKIAEDGFQESPRGPDGPR